MLANRIALLQPGQAAHPATSRVQIVGDRVDQLSDRSPAVRGGGLGGSPRPSRADRRAPPTRAETARRPDRSAHPGVRKPAAGPSISPSSAASATSAPNDGAATDQRPVQRAQRVGVHRAAAMPAAMGGLDGRLVLEPAGPAVLVCARAAVASPRSISAAIPPRACPARRAERSVRRRPVAPRAVASDKARSAPPDPSTSGSSGSSSARISRQVRRPRRTASRSVAHRARPASRSRRRRRRLPAPRAAVAARCSRSGTTNGIPVSRMRFLARTSRCAIVAGSTANAAGDRRGIHSEHGLQHQRRPDRLRRSPGGRRPASVRVGGRECRHAGPAARSRRTASRRAERFDRYAADFQYVAQSVARHGEQPGLGIGGDAVVGPVGSAPAPRHRPARPRPSRCLGRGRRATPAAGRTNRG